MPDNQPYAIATLVAAFVSTTPTGGINLLDVSNGVVVDPLPAPLPPFFVVCIVQGGGAERAYTSEWRLRSPAGEILGTVAGPIVPFSDKIRRANVWVQMPQMTADNVLKQEGDYSFEFLLDGRVLGMTEWRVTRSSRPGTSAGPP